MPRNETQDPAQTQEGSGWRPTDGDMLSGNIVAVSKAWSDWTNSFYPLITVHDQTQDRDVDVHCFHHTLRSAMMENKPKVGDPIEITYVGKQPTKDGKRQVAVYRVTMPNATGAEVWDALDSQDKGAAQAARQGTLPPDLDERYGDTLPE